LLRKQEGKSDPEIGVEEAVGRFLTRQANPDMRRPGAPAGRVHTKRPVFNLKESLTPAQPKPEPSSEPVTPWQVREVDRLVRSAHLELPELQRGVQRVQERIEAIRSRPVRVAACEIEEMMAI